MASVPYEIIAASKPFRFLVGPDKKEFSMHAELVARMSKPLWTLVNGEWKESKERFTEWPDVDEGTFVRFCEFAYTGDYKAAEPFEDTPEVLNGEKSSEATASTPGPTVNGERIIEEASAYDEPSPEDPWDTLRITKKSKARKYSPYPGESPSPPSNKDIMWRKFQEEINDEPDRRVKETSNTDPSKNYSEVLLSHARLYALADCYDIDTLMGLSIRKLHRTLKVFNLHKGARVTDVAQLVDYSYKNTMNKGDEPDKLRSLLATYVACNIEEMWPNVYFQDVLESADASKAIIGELLRRLN
ncbi:hypothetical protein F5Y00DRAFT_155049 [Daldinia vernicosa]|uniref:uncharacterized protein n=1 Tax=Daldinia vernicosa TaxID=114800 RepID=UPI0020085B35|nr:uncharacterized protein F5Y00DRAFT_155049 [Daldinia vernicosa]KAI0852812.1 hypothetical protein F5Y00DRAFT_155049 [Daldinia vernicosa]